MGSTRRGAPQIMFRHFLRLPSATFGWSSKVSKGTGMATWPVLMLVLNGAVGQLSVSVAGDVQRFWGFVRHSFERRSKVPLQKWGSVVLSSAQ